MKHKSWNRAWIPLLLLLLPVVTLSFFKPIAKWRDPVYSTGYFDPEYLYLMNSLCVLNGVPPGHKDHPGTPLQIFGGVVLKLENLGQTTDELTVSVTKDPEKYISELSFALGILCAVILAAVGLVAAQAFGSVLLGMAFQLFPFACAHPWNFLFRFTSDLPSMLMASLFSALFCLYYLRGRVSTREATLLGAVYGAAMAFKVTAALIVFFPLLLLRKDRKVLLRFFGASAASFLLLIMPIWRRGIWAFVKWNWNNITHSGKYGGGKTGLPALSSWTSNVADILAAPSIRPALFVIVLGLVYAAYLKKRKQDEKTQNLFAITALVLLFQIIIVAKAPNHYYLMAALATCSILFTGLLQAVRQPLIQFGIYLLLAIYAFQPPLYWTFNQSVANQRLVSRTEGTLGLATAIQKQGCTVIPYAPTSTSTLFALYIGDNFTRNYFAPWLEKVYPGGLIYDLVNHVFYRFDRTEVSPAAVMQMSAQNGPYCLEGNKDPTVQSAFPKPLKLKPLYENERDEILYAIETEN